LEISLLKMSATELPLTSPGHADPVQREGFLHRWLGLSITSPVVRMDPNYIGYRLQHSIPGHDIHGWPALTACMVSSPEFMIGKKFIGANMSVCNYRQCRVRSTEDKLVDLQKKMARKHPYCMKTFPTDIEAQAGVGLEHTKLVEDLDYQLEKLCKFGYKHI
jgi:hypothetical protein